jgi:hypothetical protein
LRGDIKAFENSEMREEMREGLEFEFWRMTEIVDES